MTYSFQVIVKTDEEMGTVLSALFGGLITLGKERNELKKQLEELQEVYLHQKKVLPVTHDTPLTIDGAKQLLRGQGYDVYLRKKNKNKSKSNSKKKENET